MDTSILNKRRENVYIILSGIFLSSMALLNIIGISKFIRIGPLELAVGVLAYPVTFLCTDLLCELYGPAKTRFLVWMGFFINLFIFFILWLGQILPGAPSAPPWQTISLAKDISLPSGEIIKDQVDVFYIIYACTASSLFASMTAYLTAQMSDVYLFHFWKRLTQGKHLWLRNNFSTLISQMIDTTAILAIVFGPSLLKGEMSLKSILTIWAGTYSFKMLFALFDTIPFYLGVHYLNQYLQIDTKYKSKKSS